MKRQAKASQANMFAETCEDLPIFSGAAPRCEPATFDPQPEVRTEPMFDMRPKLGDKWRQTT